jgi:4-amino-4-deoxy-L-arabinose transferase-like glycosyltransferase
VPDSLRRFALLVVIAAALICGLLPIHHSLRADDVWSRNTVMQPWSDVWRTLTADVHPPLYFVLLKPVVAACGDSEPALRALSILFYLTSVWAMYALARRFFDSAGALLATACYLTAPLAMQTADLVRMYSLLALLSIVATTALVDAVRARSVFRWSIYAVVLVAGSFTHLWFFCLLAGHGVAVVWLCRDRLFAFVATAVAALVPYAIVWLPTLLDQLRGSSEAAAWLKPPQWADLPELAILWLGPSLLLLPWAVLAGRREADSSGASRWAGAILLGSLVPPFAISFVKPFFYSRFTIIAVPLIALWVASLLIRAAKHRVAAVTMTIAAFGAVLALGIHLQPESLTSRRAAEVLLQQAKSGDSVIYTSLTRPAITYYLDREQRKREWNEVTFPQEIDMHPGYEGAIESRVALAQKEARKIALDFLNSAPGTKLFLLEGRHPRLEEKLKSAIGKPGRAILSGAEDGGGYYKALTVFEN